MPSRLSIGRKFAYRLKCWRNVTLTLLSRLCPAKVLLENYLNANAPLRVDPFEMSNHPLQSIANNSFGKTLARIKRNRVSVDLEPDVVAFQVEANISRGGGRFERLSHS